MPFKTLYHRRQSQPTPLPLSWYVNDAKELSWVEDINIKRSSVLSKLQLRGLVIKHGPGYMPHNMVADYSIILANELSREEERFVTIKELMHLYFGPDGGVYATNSEIVFENHMNEFFGGSAALETDQVRAEKEAVWMAMSMLCPEQARRELRDSVAKGRPIEEAADYLRAPVRNTRAFLSPQYEREITEILSS